MVLQVRRRDVALESRLVVFGEAAQGDPDLSVLLRARGFQVYRVQSEDELLDAFEFSCPDAAVLVGPDLPDLDRLLDEKKEGRRPLIVVVWPSIPVGGAVQLLDAGVDHVSAVYQPDWLAAQIRASLRRVGEARIAPSMIELGGLRIDLDQRQVSVGGRPLQLTPTEFGVLRILTARPGVVLASGEIMQQVLGSTTSESEAQDLLKVHIHRLRQKLEQDATLPGFIRTVRGHGYMYSFERRSQVR